MIGVSRETGKALDDYAHLRQSIRDILTTPIGSRVMRRDYGSRLFELIDAPMDGEFAIEVIAATAEALAQWEPRIGVTAVRVATPSADGTTTITLEGRYLPDGNDIRIEGIVV